MHCVKRKARRVAYPGYIHYTKCPLAIDQDPADDDLGSKLVTFI